jgi:hypothetical protein
LPAHRSTKAVLLSAVPKAIPTAVHTLPDVHDTPKNRTCTAPGTAVGFAVGWTNQRVPFQRSATVPLSAEPTAVQIVAETQDTAIKSLR